MSFERLHLIGRQPNSVLYKGNVYPSVKYFVRAGDEAQCEQELGFLLSSLRDFTDIHLVVTLLIERPFPRLDSILQFLRRQTGFVRFIVLSLQRSPGELIKSMEERLTASAEKDEPEQDTDLERLRRIGAQLDAKSAAGGGTVDPYELLQAVEEATKASIRTDDFVPIASAILLEPLLAAIGYGTFRLRASPFCGY